DIEQIPLTGKFDLIVSASLCSGVKGKLNWDKSYISEKDSVFPAQNQLNWCKKEGIPAVSLPGGHYPFYRFRSWREILEK
ncbi:MAG: hypothetical protein ACLUN1_06690, partial [Odoribacter splanchnicus]